MKFWQSLLQVPNLKSCILGSLAISREVKKHCNIRLDGCVRARDYKLFMDNHSLERFENN